MNTPTTIQAAEKSLMTGITEAIGEQINATIFRQLGTEVRVIANTSFIDGEYILFVPTEPEKFEQNFDIWKSVIKKSLGFELCRSDIGFTKLITESGVEQTQIYYIQIVRNIEDMEELGYAEHKDICMQVMVGKSVDREIRLIDSIEKKVVICFWPKGSGLTNLKTVFEQEVSNKRKHAKIVEITNFRDAGGQPTAPGIYFVDSLTEDEANTLRTSNIPNLVVIELRTKGFGVIYDKDTEYKIRTFKA